MAANALYTNNYVKRLRRCVQKASAAENAAEIVPPVRFVPRMLRLRLQFCKYKQADCKKNDFIRFLGGARVLGLQYIAVQNKD